MIIVECDKCKTHLREDERSMSLDLRLDGEEGSENSELQLCKKCYEIAKLKLEAIGFELPEFDDLFEAKD